MRIVTLDIKDMFVNLLIKGIIKTAQFWLNKHNNKQVNEQLLHMLNIIMNQNYFQYEGQIFQPQKYIAMGSPISSSMAETCLQYFEAIYSYIKHWLDNRDKKFKMNGATIKKKLAYIYLPINVISPGIKTKPDQERATLNESEDKA